MSGITINAGRASRQTIFDGQQSPLILVEMLALAYKH